MMSTPNFYKLETNRWDLGGYDEITISRIDTTKGVIKLPKVPGLGIEMNMDYLKANEIPVA
jgi:galactonate dehydratase